MHEAVERRSDEITATISEVLGVEPELVTEEALFREDLGADSLKLIELLASFEVEFDVEIGTDHLERMVNVRGVKEVLDETLSAARP
ncbi:acyl carrier protein [Umezawaea beigongshangensis]|uniref:acyl carrier protein n=1 Tax=Umezawaea beigongshangensis TaxID=2780383 RepID=UPI0018F202EB